MNDSVTDESERDECQVEGKLEPFEEPSFFANDTDKRGAELKCFRYHIEKHRRWKTQKHKLNKSIAEESLMQTPRSCGVKWPPIIWNVDN